MNSEDTDPAPSELSWYSAGLDHGIEIGRRQVEDEVEQTWAAVRAVAHQTAQGVPYADLAERRGEPKRAARQRQILTERGVSA